MWVVVFAIGVPSAIGFRWRTWPFYLRNPTACALVLAKFAGFGWFQITGDNLPVEFYLFPDIAVVAVIVAKHEPFLGVLATLQRILRQNTPDRVILLIFPVMWALYLLKPVAPFHVWWSLWALVIVQFVAAGCESLVAALSAKRKASEPTPIIDRHLVVIPFPVQRRGADAVRKTPDCSGALLTANGGGGGG